MGNTEVMFLRMPLKKTAKLLTQTKNLWYIFIREEVSENMYEILNGKRYFLSEGVGASLLKCAC
jgi:IS4 transposase